MIDDFVTFFIAGQETTANTLSFCFLELAKNKELVKKARAEIDQVLGDRTEISYQDALALKYCNCIFKEALRMYPPVASTGRQVDVDIDMLGYKVPRGTFIQVKRQSSNLIEIYATSFEQFES